MLKQIHLIGSILTIARRAQLVSKDLNQRKKTKPLTQEEQYYEFDALSSDIKLQWKKINGLSKNRALQRELTKLQKIYGD